MSQEEILAACTGFEWDEGNLVKNWERHRVSASECEQIFFNRPLVTAADLRHSEQEARFFALGHTDSGRPLFVVFTVRDRRIRVISARDMNRKEKEGVRGIMKKKIPRLASEDAERDFWAKADSTQYVDWKRAKRQVFSNLTPSLKTISLRLPELMLEELKLLANKRDVPYQSLLKIFLAERIEQELKASRPRRAQV